MRIDGSQRQSLGGSARSYPFTGLSPDTDYRLEVRATIRGRPSDWVPMVRTTKPTPVSLSASVSPSGCETGASVTVEWSVEGSSGAYRVTVDGAVNTGTSTQTTSQQTAGSQTIRVVATDARHVNLSDSQNLSVTVKSPPLPDQEQLLLPDHHREHLAVHGRADVQAAACVRP